MQNILDNKSDLFPLALEVLGLQRRSIRLRSCLFKEWSGELGAFVEGIPIGRLKVDRSIDAGEIVDLPLEQFPFVVFPAKIRLALDDAEVASPYIVHGPEEVMGAFGPADLTVENLSFDSGMLRGTFVAHSNGSLSPAAYVKINGMVVRSIVVEPARNRDEGGAVCRFAVPVRPSDFTESGLDLQIFIAGIEHPVASYTYGRMDSMIDAKRLIELDEANRQTKKFFALQVAMLEDRLDHRLVLQQQRMDSFIEHTVSFLIDVIAGQNGNIDLVGLKGALLAMRPSEEMIEAPPLLAMEPEVIIQVDSTLFSFGWYSLEATSRGPFRWMGRTALLNNPNPSRPISEVQLWVSQVYGAHEPMLRATMDDVELMTKIARQDDLFLVRLVATQNGIPALAQSVLIESFVVGVPANDQGVSDNRMLSIAVERAVFVYDADTLSDG